MKREWLEATQNGDVAAIEALLASGVDVNSLDRHGQTALMNAAHTGKVEVVRLLAKSGADLNHTAKYQLSALMLSVISGHLEVARALVLAGADLTRKGTGPFSCTPLEYAQRQQNHEMCAILRSYT